MSLRPTAIAQERAGAKALYVVIDDPETVGVLLLPTSFGHRRVVSRSELTADFELHPARPADQLGELLKAVEPSTVDGGVGCGSEEVDALVETYERIVSGLESSAQPVERGELEGLRTALREIADSDIDAWDLSDCRRHARHALEKTSSQPLLDLDALAKDADLHEASADNREFIDTVRAYHDGAANALRKVLEAGPPATGQTPDLDALKERLTSDEVVEAVAEAMWNEREYRDPSGKDGMYDQPTPEPILWEQAVKEERFEADLRDYRNDARAALEAARAAAFPDTEEGDGN